MDEDKPKELEKSVEEETISVSSSAIELKPDSPHKKSHKLLTIFLIVIGLFGVLLLLFPLMLKILNINPEAKFAEATLKACTEKCSGSKDSACVNKCMEESGLKGMITPVKISPTPSPTATPSPTNLPKITYVPKVSSTPNISNVSLTIEIGNFGPEGKLLPPSDYHTITIKNNTTGKSQVETSQNQVLTYYNLDPGAYSITASTVVGKGTASYYCHDCSAQKQGGSIEGYDDNHPTVNIDIAKDRPVTIWFVYHNL